MYNIKYKNIFYKLEKKITSQPLSNTMNHR